jgi:hypothetical protein
VTLAPNEIVTVAATSLDGSTGAYTLTFRPL